MKRERIHHYIYFGCLLLLAIATPLSNFLLSIGGIFISVNWALSGQWKRKWQRLKDCPTALWLSLFFLLCAIPLFYAEFLSVGFANLLNKLPLLYAPIILATSDPLQGKEQRAVMNAFIVGVFIGTAASYFHYFTQSINDIREISVFISHIRFSLCLDLAICLALYLAAKIKSYPKGLKAIYILLSLWFVIYLFFAQTLTGILILFLLLVFIFFYILRYKPIPYGIGISVICITLIVTFIFYNIVIVRNYYTSVDDEEHLEQFTANGNPYEHNTYSIVENGHKTELYICRQELADQWQKISDHPYDGWTEATIIRYLNSKGLRKDSAALASLSVGDIRNIEKGYANVDYTHGLGVKRSLFPILYSFSRYQLYEKIDNSTMLQRVELWKTTWRVIRQHPWAGVGLGDHKYAIDKQLELDDSPLNYRRNMGAHNQFFTYWLIGGIFLLLYFVFILFLPFFTHKKKVNILYFLFFIIIFISLFTEDTLETQVGVSLYAIFNSLFLFVFDKKQMEKDCCYIGTKKRKNEDS